MFTEIQRSIFTWALIAIVVSVWTYLIGSNIFFPPPQTEALAIAIITLILCWIVYRIPERWQRLRSHILVIGLWVCTLLALLMMKQPMFAVIFGIIVLLSNGLLGLPTTLVIASMSTLIVINLSAVEGDYYSEIIVHIFIWGNLIMGYIISHFVWRGIDILQSIQIYATQQMNEARVSRAELKKANKALLEAHERVRHMNSELRYARDAAEEARQLKARFAANVSHELRTPINLIVGFSELMAIAPEVYGSQLPSAYRADVRAIYRNAKHLQKLINDILDISQIESGHLAVVKENVKPRLIILEAVAMIRELAESKGLELQLQIPQNLPRIYMDTTRIRQVLLNLLANAIRHTDEGSILLEVCLDDTLLTIHIIDTGIGIPVEDHKRVFEDFYQVASENLSGGTGLGLALSRRFVTQHGGRMWVESDGIPGKGSRFSFTLPIENQTAPKYHRINQTISKSYQPNIVVMDSDPLIVELFTRYTQNCTVHGSHTLDEARQLIERVRPLAFIYSNEADISKLNPDHQTTLIQFPMPSGRRAMLAHKVTDYLVKPVTREVLLDTLKNIKKPIHNILVIDDDRDVVRMFRRMLQSAESAYTVWEAYGGEEGLEKLSKELPDAIILDIMMPDITGYQILQHVKAEPRLQHIPVIVASARGAEEGITNRAEGDIIISRQSGYTPMELIHFIEALIRTMKPQVGLASREMQADQVVS